jgi:Zn-dependent metalloprotease/subtilisin-like proprotein convertase family protein
MAAELSARQRRALNNLERVSPDARIQQIRWDKDCTNPKFISGILSERSQDNPESIARRFLQQISGLVTLPEDVEERLDLSNITIDSKGYRHAVFQQVINGVPVFEGSIQVHINPEGQVVSVKANRATQVDVAVIPTISADQAIERAKQEFGEAESNKVPPESQLMLFMDDAGRVYLTWHIRVFSDQDMAGYYYFLDAHTGLLLYKYNDMRHVMARETHTANNDEVLPGQQIIREGDSEHSDNVAWDAHANAGIVYDYFHDRFGRDSYDDQGSRLRSTVHYSQRYNNAFWTSSLQQMVYGDGDGVNFSPLSAALDVVAHELTHAVTSSTARFVYVNEAGALDESFADFFGVMVSNDDPVTDWKMGEHVYTPGRPGDALRDMSDPPRGDQPDHADNQLRLQPGELPECNSRSPRYNDNGYVHSNSGIPNKAFFLMVAGGTHHGIQVQGLGKTVAEEIVYLALTVYLQSATPSRWTFRQARLATMDACMQLYPGDQAKLASVMNAWAAVGVGEPAEPEQPPVESVVRAEAAPHLPIPDATPRGITSVLTISRIGQIRSAKVAVDIAHTYIGDLRIILTAPDGKTALLHDKTGGSAENIVKTYDVSNTPGLAELQGGPLQGDWQLSVSDHWSVDVGQLRRWSLEIEIEPTNVAKGETAPALQIPDNDSGGISSTLEIAQAGTIRDIKAWVNITHTWIGDLKVELVDPSGEVVTLHNRSGGNQENLRVTYDKEEHPALQNFEGDHAQGTWRLKVTDLAQWDVGTLNKWGLEITL